MDYRSMADQIASGQLGAAGAAGKNLEAARRALELPEPARSLSSFAEPMGIDFGGATNPEGERRLRLSEPDFEGGLDAGSTEGLDDWGEDFAGVAVDPGMMGDQDKMAAVSEIIKRLSSVPEGQDSMVTENPAVRAKLAGPETIIEKLGREVRASNRPYDDSMMIDPLDPSPQPPRQPRRRREPPARYAPGKAVAGNPGRRDPRMSSNPYGLGNQDVGG